MARPVSWLPRLHQIDQRVRNSVRSHYQRSELERLFELQPRSAQLLMDAMPTIGIGRSRLVERDHLLSFLEQVREAGDPAQVIERARSQRAAPSRRTLRQLVAYDEAPATWETLPASLTLSPGQVVIQFDRIEDLARSLLALASLLDQDLEEFANRYELRPLVQPTEGAEDVVAMFKELEAIEAGKP